MMLESTTNQCQRAVSRWLNGVVSEPMTLKEKEGYELAKGAMLYVSKCVVTGIILILGWTALRNVAGWGTDDSDQNGWNRSGLRIHKDAKTGVEYLSDGNGGIIRRESR